MAISSSSEIIREMKSTLQNTVKEIQNTQTNVKNAMRLSVNWNDEQGRQYQELMKRIAQLTVSPAETLVNAIPKLDQLARTLDAYGKVRF